MTRQELVCSHHYVMFPYTVLIKNRQPMKINIHNYIHHKNIKNIDNCYKYVSLITHIFQFLMWSTTK